MLAYFKYRWKLRNHLKELDEIESRFQPRLDQAQGDSKETQCIINEKTKEIIIVRDLILRLGTDYLYKKAAKKLLPTPFDDKFWEDSFAIPCTKHLNEEGLLELRKTLREERHARSQSIVVWVSAFTGLIGAATGLAAVLLS